jgi:hypothetical protein
VVNKTDQEIQQDIFRELRWDSRVDQTEVGVQVDQGIVTLGGTVNSYAKKLAAREAAHRVVGVLDVANGIQVKRPGGRQDTLRARMRRTHHFFGRASPLSFVWATWIIRAEFRSGTRPAATCQERRPGRRSEEVHSW